MQGVYSANEEQRILLGVLCAYHCQYFGGGEHDCKEAEDGLLPETLQ